MSLYHKMVYKGRVVVVGMYENRPFAGFILSSRTEPDRTLSIEEEKRKVWVSPGESLREKISERPFESVDDLYACLIGFYDTKKNPTVTSFNGRMSNRVKAMMEAGESAEASLRQILPVFPPIPRDPRIGAVLSMGDSGKPYFYFGVYDRTAEPYLAVQQVTTSPNSARYISLDDFSNIPEIKLAGSRNLDELSRQIFDKILGTPDEFGCGSAVCMIDGKEFKFGVYKKESRK